MATQEVVPSVPCMGNEILYFSWRMRLRAATCGSPAVEGSHYPVNKAKSRRRVKCWPMRCLRLRRIPTSEALKKQRWMKELSARVDIRSQVLGTFENLLGIAWIHFFFFAESLMRRLEKPKVHIFFMQIGAETLVYKRNRNFQRSFLASLTAIWMYQQKAKQLFLLLSVLQMVTFWT